MQNNFRLIDFVQVFKDGIVYVHILANPVAIFRVYYIKSASNFVSSTSCYIPWLLKGNLVYA